jgi:pimeloyl-ACP methyl ester carboxylesterase
VQTATTPDGATIAYEVTGSGPALVLVHGITDSHRAWDPLLPDLATDHQVIAVDLRGHGESARRPPYEPITLANDVRAVVDNVGVDDPMLVGHSLGGVVVSAYAAFHPTRKVMNIDQALELSGFKDALASVEPMLRGTDAEFQAVMSSLTDMLFGPLGEAERERLRAQCSPEQDVVLGVWSTVLDSSAEELDTLLHATAGTVSAPYLALHGSDPGPDYPAYLKSLIPQAQLEVWPDLGHFPHLVEPQRFLARLREFEQS